ncbi:MAG: sulfite exporter TauE/SafE family protein [Burkholderiales bacterium]|nr:sulfite exporter TauE/SafE family protein [Phycisphaerae bacterium]
MTTPPALIAFGLFVGIFSGLMGLGGGAVMIPIMVLALGFEQARAHGMSLMVMIPPVALPAVIRYFKDGYLKQDDIWTAALIAVGVLGGTYFGAKIATSIAQHKGMLAIVFGLLLVYVAMYTALGKANVARSVVLALMVTMVAAAVVFGTRWYDARAYQASAIAPAIASAESTARSAAE